MLDSKALTKIHSVILIGIIVIAGIGGGAAYVLLSEQEQSSETIKIGVFADLDAMIGRGVHQAVILAAEQINAEGGILGRQIEVFGEDNDVDSGVNAETLNLALIRLLTYHKVDFIIGIAASEGYMIQDIIAQHKKIFFEIGANQDAYTQRVIDNYDKYKYYFRLMFNTTSMAQGLPDSLIHLREQTGFNKVGYIGEESIWKGVMEGLDHVLPNVYGFDLVYKGAFPLGTYDFSSYFAAAEAAGVEIMLPLIVLDEAIPFVKEYSERQSPMVIYSGVLGQGISGPNGWEITEGKCEYTSSSSSVVVAGYPLTTKTLSAREAYIERWGEIPGGNGAIAYDLMRYTLPDAIKRAGTLEVDTVINALEQTSIETSLVRNFVFTSSHDLMIGENPNDPDADYSLIIIFQWINGEQVPVYPKKIMEEAGATYTFPDWPGPWDNLE